MTRIFIASSTEARPYAEMVATVLAEQGATPALWWSQNAFPLGVTLIEALENLSEVINGAVIIMTPDDRVARRGIQSFNPASNILLEYGLFVGSLGRLNVAIVKIGGPTTPSDLDGVVHVRVRPYEENEDLELYRTVILKPALTAWMHELEARSTDGARIATLVHRIAPNARPEDRLRIKARMLSERLDPQVFSRLTPDTLEHLLLKYTFNNDPNNTVGYSYTTSVRSYLALTRVVPSSDDERSLAAHLARHLAELIAGHQIEPTILAISKNAALGLLQEVARQLRFPTILINPYGPNRESPIEGYYESGDRAVLLHDVVLSGHHLIDCIATLRDSGLYVNHLIALAEHDSDDSGLRALMRENSVEMFMSAILLSSNRRVVCRTPSIGNESYAMPDCVLCDVVAERVSVPVWNIMTVGDISSEFLAESENFIAVADVAPLTPGHTLIVYRHHDISFSKLTAPLVTELDQFRQQVAEVLSQGYSQRIVMFEHGLCNRARAGGCGIDHAHLHLVPLDRPLSGIFRRDFEVEQLGELEAISERGGQDSEYLLLTDVDGVNYMAFTHEPTRQYFRRVISALLGRDLWNWNDELLLGQKNETRNWILDLHRTFTQPRAPQVEPSQDHAV